jgi:hypothetical protein
VTAVTLVGPVTLTVVAAEPPIVTDAAVRLVPSITTVSPPATLPSEGATVVTVGSVTKV